MPVDDSRLSGFYKLSVEDRGIRLHNCRDFLLKRLMPWLAMAN